MGYTHGIKWTDELAIEKLNYMIEIAKLNHFPSKKDIEEFYGSKSLGDYLSRHGGVSKWAKMIGLPEKNSTSNFGSEYELQAINDIDSELGYSSIKTKPRHPYDILVNNNIKIDVKVSIPFKNNCNSYANSFNLEKSEPTCDLFILYCLNRNKVLEKRIILPSCVVSGMTQIGVGKNSKYDKFMERWDLIKKYNDFYEELQKERL